LGQTAALPVLCPRLPDVSLDLLFLSVPLSVCSG